MEKIELLPKIEEAARLLYNPKLPYHNFDHALKVRERAHKIVRDCEAEGVPVDREVVDLAILFHDAGYHEDFKNKGFDSREAYASYLAEKSLEGFGYDSDAAEKVAKIIMSTHKDRPFEMNEEKVVRAADLVEIADNYPIFMDNNKRLKKEVEMLSGKETSIKEWKKKTEEIINFYLGQDIRLTKTHDDESGESIFHKKARANLQRFLEEN